jgi:NAD(P)-dependent dehydrogenase (short-subunit alcohol dehydrogenase family)
MLKTIHRRPVLITGASSGIGRACAVRLARAGFLVLAGVRTDADAQAVEHDGTATPHGIRALHIDVTSADSIANAAAKIRSLVGGDGLCGLVNNAGICVVGPAECVSLDDWRRQFEVNLFGSIAVTQAVLPLLRLHVASHGKWAARIVNISSVTGKVPTALFGAYSASKAALESLNDVLRQELAGHGIHVCKIVPGTIQSEIWRKEKQGVATIHDNPAAMQLYGELIDRVAASVFKTAETAKPADRVAKAVQDCLNRPTPRTQILVAWEAQVGSRAKKILPDRVLDFLMAKTLGTPTGK